jgi:hypothetical protein
MFMIRVCFAVSLAARILGLASIWARWVATQGWMLLGAVALGIALPGVVATFGDPAHAGVTLEERKMPMSSAGSPASRIARAAVRAGSTRSVS